MMLRAISPTGTSHSGGPFVLRRPGRPLLGNVPMLAATSAVYQVGRDATNDQHARPPKGVDDIAVVFGYGGRLAVCSVATYLIAWTPILHG